MDEMWIFLILLGKEKIPFGNVLINKISFSECMINTPCREGFQKNPRFTDNIINSHQKMFCGALKQLNHIQCISFEVLAILGI